MGRIGVKLDIAPSSKAKGAQRAQDRSAKDIRPDCPRSARQRSPDSPAGEWTEGAGAHPSIHHRPQDQRQQLLWDLDLLTPDDVCTLLKVKKSWLYDTVESGTIEALRLGKQLRFRPSAIASYLAERARTEKRT
jgi:excisionase family DNA binding protein